MGGYAGIAVCLATALSLFATPVASERPVIKSDFETILEAGANHRVLCKGHNPISWNWTIPSDASEQIADNATEIWVDSEPRWDGRYKYQTTLIIRNITYPFVGYYRCFEDGHSPLDEQHSSKIYLFVKDERHAAVSDLEVVTITVTQYEEAVLPCRPTSPDVTVELFYLSGQQEVQKVYTGILREDNVMYRYHPHLGFVTNDTMVAKNNMFRCVYSRENVTEFSTTQLLEIETKTDFLPTPLVENLSAPRGTVVGDKLVLACKVTTYNTVNFKWKTPEGEPDLKRMKLEQMKMNHNTGEITQELIITETTLADKGEFTCVISDIQEHSSSNSLNVVIYRLDEHFLNLTEENEFYTLSTQVGHDPFVVWRIDVRAHPEPKLTWINNKNKTITDKWIDKYETSVSSTVAVLKIKDITIDDYGTYTLRGETLYDSVSLPLFLNISDKPTVHIDGQNFYFVNRPSTVSCTAAASPPPEISWSFKRCESCNFEPMNETFSNRTGLQVTSYVSIKATDSGSIRCFAQNEIGEDEVTQGFYVSDVQDGLDIFGLDPTVDVDERTNEATIANGETLRMVCGASVHNYTSDIQWYFNEEPLDDDNLYTLERSNTSYTSRATLTVPQVDSKNSGVYRCRVKTRAGDFVYQNITVNVTEPTKPVITRTNMLKDIAMKLPMPLLLTCEIGGIPKPTVQWFKNDEILQPTDRIRFRNYNQNVSFYYTDAKDEATYKCEATNREGVAVRQISLKFSNKPKQMETQLIIIIAVLGVVVVVAVIMIVIKLINEKRLQKELRIAGLANFEKGALENLNPELGIDDQAELLPYDKKWEFPIDKLKLGKQLGSGAFGVVMKGEAKGILDEEGCTTVAVKMVKRNAEHTYIKALASELKIMVHLGKHLNVVNLLGACTKNVAKRELLVIVEYCRFGNLHNYLLRHRENFIDQVDPKTGHIDYTIGMDILERTYSDASNRSMNGGIDFPPEMVDYRGPNYTGGGVTAKTYVTSVSMSPSYDSENAPVLSNNSVQPEWRSNYRGDYKGSVRPICTTDLLTWAFQVSRGMEYLASRKVMHGDLAARNILLADNNIVKICDFGLAKSMYKNDNYKKKGDGPLPVKWMAIESIRDRVFSTQSDVWSFGIVLWEFCSLARTPYPGMEADERLYNKLIDGYRMESPEFAPKELYKMMLDCWQPRPTSRPSFTRLAERIGCMLEDSVRKHYIDLNDPYLVMNTRRLEDGHSDYLMMLSPPNFDQLSSPRHYTNSPNSPNSPAAEEATPGYLCMKPSIFSPRAEDERIFDFSTSSPPPRTKTKSAESTDGTELLPMLGVLSVPESDSDSTPASPAALSPTSFANPSYHLPPKVTAAPRDDDSSALPKEPHVTKDNYVNMPQNKSAKGAEMNNNPFSSDIQEKDINRHYVNSNSRDWEAVTV